MIIKEFIKASYTYDMTNKELDLMLLLFKVHCWDGSIPLNRKQLAKQVKCSRNTLKDCILRLIKRGAIKLTNGVIFLTKYQTYSKGKDVTPYIPKLSFLYSKMFRSLTINAKRFILEVLSNGFYRMVNDKRQEYDVSLLRNWHITDLYHQTVCGKSRKKSDISKKGMFNVFDRKEIENIIDIVKPYLNVQLNINGGVTVKGLNHNIKRLAIKSYGEKYSLFKKLIRSGIDFSMPILNAVYKNMASLRDNSTSCITVIKQAVDYALDNCLYSEDFRVNLMNGKYEYSIAMLKDVYKSSFFNLFRSFISNISIVPVNLFDTVGDYFKEMTAQECKIIQEEVENKVFLGGGGTWLKSTLSAIRKIMTVEKIPPLYNWLLNK